MKTTQCYLYAEVLSPVTEREVDVTCTYHVSNHSYRPERCDDRATITSVLDREGYELLPLLDPSDVAHLERQALAAYQDENSFSATDL